MTSHSESCESPESERSDVPYGRLRPESTTDEYEDCGSRVWVDGDCGCAIGESLMRFLRPFVMLVCGRCFFEML